MMRKILLIMLMIAVILAGMNASAQAAPTFQGRPTAKGAPASAGYYIWQEGDRWQVEMLNFGPQRSFTGTITTDGAFSDVAARSPEKTEGRVLEVSGNKIGFTFNTPAQIDGFFFTVKTGKGATFTLYVDGQPVAASFIYLGRQNQNPGSYYFSLRTRDDPQPTNAPKVLPANNRVPPTGGQVLTADDLGLPTGDQVPPTNVQTPPADDQGISLADVQGRPTALIPGNSFGYFIWQEGDLWIVEATTKGEKRKFTGTIFTSSTFASAAALNPHGKDSVRLNALFTRIKFTFRTGGERSGFLINGRGDDMQREWPDSVSGVTFVVADGTTVKFILNVDGQPIDPADVYIGSGNRHPTGMAVKAPPAAKVPPESNQATNPVQ